MNSAIEMTYGLRGAAQELLRRHFSIFPCRPRGKEPLGSYAQNGFKNAANDESVLKAWDDGIAANIGVACEASSITVLDCDTGFTSREDAMSWAHDLGFETLIVQTGRANGYGVHFYFSGTMRSCSFELNGVSGEVKSAGGYVIGPGSVHESGKLYEIVHDVPMAALPACLTNLGIGKTTNTNAKTVPVEALIPQGKRRNYLLRLAGNLANERLSENGIYDALIDFLKSTCEDGATMAMTDDKDIRRIAHDASTKWDRKDGSVDAVEHSREQPTTSPSSHLTDALYGFYVRALEQSKNNMFYFSGRKFSKKFYKMSDSTAYRRAYALESSGWFKVVRRGGSDEVGRSQCTIYHIRNLEEWEHWKSQQPMTPAMKRLSSKSKTEACCVWLEKRLGNGPVYSDVLETERKSLEYTRRVYGNARTALNVNWSQDGRRRLSWIGSNRVIFEKDTSAKS